MVYFDLYSQANSGIPSIELRFNSTPQIIQNL